MAPLRRPRLALLVAALGAALSSPAAAADAPVVSRVVIKKDAHELSLVTGRGERERVLATYKVAIGPGGGGPKLREGDLVTPVGRYRVVARHRSQFEFFLRLDYPNAEDRARFAALKESGALPPDARIGGDIGIHGPPTSLDAASAAALGAYDWTLGCVAVSRGEIRQIARLVRDGTVVDIED